MLQTRNGADGHADAIGSAGCNERRFIAREGLHKGFDSSRRIDAALDAHPVDFRSDRCLRRWGNGLHRRGIFLLPKRVPMRRQDEHSCEERGKVLKPDHVENSG